MTTTMTKRKYRTLPAARMAALKRAGGRCEDCKCILQRGCYHAHHITYERLHSELPEDLEILCLACHNKRHPWHNFKPHNNPRKRTVKIKAPPRKAKGKTRRQQTFSTRHGCIAIGVSRLPQIKLKKQSDFTPKQRIRRDSEK